jgi:hypothetical protein
VAIHIETRGFQTAESTQQVCSASKGSYNWTEGQNKGREKRSLYVPKVSGRQQFRRMVARIFPLIMMMRSFFVMACASLLVVSR